MKRGRIKKAIGDLLRHRQGTPGHVVVLALLAAKMDRPSLAIAVFKKFESQFPEARVFFESWREQFGENAGPPEVSYAAAIRYGIETKSYAPLVAFLSSGLSTNEAIIAGAEFLMARKAYTEVVDLRAGLSSIGTARSVEIAAVAAFRLGDFNDSIEILADASRAGLSLPPRLVQLRLRAQEASGDHFNLIKDLRALLRESDDPDLRGRLFDAYVRIGALEDAAQVTKDAIAAGSLDNVNALRVANVLRNFAPETARRAIADIRPDELPKELLPNLLGLSAELGLREVQDEMVRRLFADLSPDGAVTRFDSVEAVIEFMNDRADKYRATIEQWLAGVQPAAVAFSGNCKDYALLLLGDRRTRRANMGYSFPMMLTAGTHRSADTLETVGRPGLRMELGALLLADRFRLLDEIEQVFEIYVPPSLPEALVEIRGHFRGVSDAVASQLRAIGRRDSAVQVLNKPGEGAQKIQFLHQAPDGDDSRLVFLSVLEHAFQGGHVTKAEKQSARAALGVSDDEPLPEMTFDSVVIGSQALFDLVGLGILEGIARSFSVAVLDTELEQHLKQIDVVEAEGRIGIKVEELRKTVADRLGSSAWHTLPSRDTDFQSMRMQPPAHVCCLIETLPHEEAEAPSLFWFEDRTLSRNPPSGAVNLGQILTTLRKSQQLTDDEYFQVLKKLRDAGYSFLPIDADELFAQIRSAPIVSDSVVENDDLASIRSWFAQDAINLKFIDLTVEIDSSGRVLGESRRTLQLTHLVQDLFALVWSDESATSIEKTARSLWIWTNLRLDCTPAPVGPENPQIRRQFAALNVAQTLALTLHAELGTPEIPKPARQEMVDWLVSVAIEPLAEADPAALELVWDTLAGMLTRLLEPTEERDEKIRQALDAHMKRIVAGYLRLLPVEWGEQIVSRSGADGVLTRQTVMLLEVGNDQVAVESIAKAFSDAAASQTNSARFKYYKSGKSALLTLEGDENGIPTGTIKRGRRSGSIDAVTVAMLHPDPLIREQIFLSTAEIGSVGRPISQEERVSLALEPDAERRVEILHEFYAADFSRSLSQLDIRIQRKGQLNIDDFDLPDPDVLLNYLGLASDFVGGGIELSANAFKAINEKISAREAVWRVSSLPVRLPEEVLPDFAAAVETPKPGAHRYFMLDMAGAFARARTSGLPGEDLAFLGQVTDERLNFFRKVLVHGARQALRSGKWSEVDPDLVSYLLWLYADQLVRVLNPSEGSLAQLSAWLSTRSRRRLLDDEEIWGKWTKRCLFNLSPNRLKGAFVAELIELGVAIPPDLVSMVGKPVGSGDWLPNPELFATAPPDAPMECWISADPIPGFARVGWIGETHPFVARDPSILLRNIMGEVQVENWRVLLPLVALIIDLDDIDAETISALRERVEEYLILKDAYDPDPARSALFDVLADIYGQQKDREAFTGLLTNVIRLVKSKWPRDVADLHGDAESDRFAIELANATYVFCWAWHSDHVSRVNLFCEILRQAAEAWPGFSPFAIALLENIVVQVDMPTAAAAIWPVLFQLRANR